MGASESKLVFKQGIFRLSEEQGIPASDPYWTGFWELPESVEDVFSLFSGTDIRRARDASLENFETLLLAVTSRLNILKSHPSFPDPELAPERDALNCIRVLTRVLPYIYEAENLAEWEEKFFWGSRRRKSRRAQVSDQVLFDENEKEDDTTPASHDQDTYEDVKPLAEELIDDLTDLLFYAGFTIPQLPHLKNKVTYAIWQSGVGCKTSLATNKELESNRCEVLRLLLTLTSKSMYTSSSVLPVKGVKALTYLTTCPDKQIVLSVLCSLVNTTMKHNSTPWRLPYDHMVWKDSKQSLIVYSLQLLLVLLLYPVPEEGTGRAPKNFYRHFLGRLHRPEDFQFLADGMTRVLNQPMQASNSYLPGSQKSVKWAAEMIILFWEVLQCNKRFRSFIIESNRAHDFVILMLFYAIEHKTDVSRQGIVRMCVFVLQTMSVESAFGKNLNKNFEGQDTLPASIRLSNFKGTYADFLIISLHTLITASKGKLDAIYPALLAIINNTAAYAQNLSMISSTKLLQLFTSMSSPSFLLANESNHALLQALLESINTIIEHQYTTNANLIYIVLRSKKRIEALRTFTLEGGQHEIERAARRRKEILSGGSKGNVTSPTLSNTAPERTNSYSRETSTSIDRATDEDSTFAIGDSDDSDEDNDDQETPSHSSPSPHKSRVSSIASSSAEDSVPIQLRGMSEKARGKMPAGAQSFSRQNSTNNLSTTNSNNSNQKSSNASDPSSITYTNTTFTPTPEWIESWLPELPLHTLLTLIKTLSPSLPRNLQPPISSSTNNTIASIDPNLTKFLSTLPGTPTTNPQIQTILSTPSPIRVHLFEWSSLSLGWYTSVLWSLIFTSEMNIGPSDASNNATSAGFPSRSAASSIGPVGIWNGTGVKLFQVSTDGVRQGPSLSQPRGAVDAVGSRLVQGVQGLGLGGLVGRVAGKDNAIAKRGAVREV